MSSGQHTAQGHDANNDPFLSPLDTHLRPQTLYQHEHHNHHPHSRPATTQNHNYGQSHHQVDEESIDPSLHDQDRRQTRTRTNRLTDFASHILGSQDGNDHPHDQQNEHGEHDEHDEHDEHVHDHRGHVLSFTGEGGVLESSNHGFHAVGEELELETDQSHAGRMAAMEDEGEFEPHIEDENDHDHDHDNENDRDFEGEEIGRQGEETQGQDHVQIQDTGRMGRKRGPYMTGRGRKRAHIGDPVDATLIKKSNHKEVERKRRNNISEGIDQLVAQMGIPELEKAGKGAQLRRAVEYMADLGERLGGVDKELGDLRREKQDLEANLALTTQRYTEEHERCTRYETLWRDAQDREAKGQFEIAQLLDEISQLRAKR